MSRPVQTVGNRAPKTGDADIRLELGSLEEMVKSGVLVTPHIFQALNGWKSRQAAWKAARAGRVFYISQQGERYFPAFYCDPAYDRKQLSAVTRALDDLPGGSKLQFFLSRRGSLNGATPLQALQAGRIEKVLDIAAAFAEIPAGDT